MWSEVNTVGEPDYDGVMVRSYASMKFKVVELNSNFSRFKLMLTQTQFLQLRSAINNPVNWQNND